MAFLRLHRLFLIALVCCLAGGGVSEPEADKAALLAFLEQTPHGNRIQWNSSASACSWRGITCDSNRSRVVALRLPGAGLVGPIPSDTLSRLDALRVLSLRSNRLSGALPADLGKLRLLRSLYLHENRLSGELPPEMARLTRLVRIDCSANNLSGSIPSALGNLTRITGLFLQNNNFSGSIPDIDIPGMVAFNVSNNRLNGSIPETLRRFPGSSFAGNLALCGGPLPPCSPFSPAPSPGGDESPAQVPSDREKERKKLSAASIIAIAVACGAVLLIALLLLVICLVRRRRRGRSPAKSPKAAAALPRSGGGAADTATTSSSREDVGGGRAGGEKNKLVFFGDGLYGFDLEDLLRASAEVLGKGSMGTSYRAVLEDGVVVVVKRLKDVALSKREFESQMDALGQVNYANVVPLRAFYYSKDEKLLVYDFFPAGSLSALLHGGRGSGRAPLDWEQRIRIAVAAGRGLAHLHTAAKVVHGNVKASNVLLGASAEAAAVADYGLAALFGGAWPSRRVAGYRAPELVETRRPSFESDVYSFGVVLLELLTGKAPNQAAAGEEGVDLPRWVQSVVREEWTAEVFDAELRRYDGIEEEMVQVLQVAMACVQTLPDSRPQIQDVVRMLEDVLNRGPPPPEQAHRASDDEHSKSGGSGDPTP